MSQVYKLIGKDFMEAVDQILNNTIAINQQSKHHTMIQTKTSTVSSIVIDILNIYKEATNSVTKNRK